MAETSHSPAAFPSTLWTEVLALRDDEAERKRQTMSRLVERYWKPVYWAIRGQQAVDDAEARDLTQEFFIQVLEGRVISTVDPSLGSFRAYLKRGLKFFLLETHRNNNRQKRSAGRPILSLDFEHAGPPPADLESDPEKALDRAWALQILRESIEELERRLKEEGRAKDVEIFLAYEMSSVSPKPTYDEVAARFGVSSDDVWNLLRVCRRRLREVLIGRISPYVKDTNEVFDELRELFGR